MLFGNENEAATFAETEGWEEKDVGVHREEACRSPSYLSSVLTASCDMKLVLCGDGHEHKMLWPREGVDDAARNVPILHLHHVYTVRNCLDQCAHLSSV